MSPTGPESDRGTRSYLADETVILEAAGDAHHLEGVRQLILRGRKLSGFDSVCASRLQRLTVLSLSNNSVRDLGDFHQMIGLVELNLNFNMVTSLRGLACPRLRRLYLSNNLIASTDELFAFPELRTLCLFKNILPDLALALRPLRRLSELRELDLGGNPCARSCGYNHRVVRACPRLGQLDGEELSQLDRDLAELYFEEKYIKMTRKATGNCRNKGMSPGPGGGRPATAPAISVGITGSKGVSIRSHRGGESRADGDSGFFEDQDGLSHERPELPPGEALFFRSDRLNNDPHLLCYLAEEALADPCRSPREAIADFVRCKKASELSSPPSRDINVDGSRAADAEVGGQQGKDLGRSPDGNCDSADGFATTRSVSTHTSRTHDLSLLPADSDNARPVEVGDDLEVVAATSVLSPFSEDMRDRRRASSTVHIPRVVGDTSADMNAAHRGDGETYTTTNGAVSAVQQQQDVSSHTSPPPPPPPPPTAQISSARSDPSNPYTTIRKLLKLIETLQLEHADRRTQDIQTEHLNDRLQKRRHVPPREEQDAKNTARKAVFCPAAPSDADEPMIWSEDLRRLRLENRNMHLLLAENRELKKDARAAKATEDEVRLLKNEVDKCREQLRQAGEELWAAREQLQQVTLSCSSVARNNGISCPSMDNSTSSTTSVGCGSTSTSRCSSRRPSSATGDAMLGSRGWTAADVLVDCEEVDEELTELFRRNEQTLGQIRRDLALARREGEDISDSSGCCAVSDLTGHVASERASFGSNTARRPISAQKVLTAAEGQEAKHGGTDAGLCGSGDSYNRVIPPSSRGTNDRPSPAGQMPVQTGNGGRRLARPGESPSDAALQTLLDSGNHNNSMDKDTSSILNSNEVKRSPAVRINSRSSEGKEDPVRPSPTEGTPYNIAMLQRGVSSSISDSSHDSDGKCRSSCASFALTSSEVNRMSNCAGIEDTHVKEADGGGDTSTGSCSGGKAVGGEDGGGGRVTLFAENARVLLTSAEVDKTLDDATLTSR